MREFIKSDFYGFTMLYMWCCMDHLAIWVYHSHGSPVLRPFSGNFLKMRLGHTTSEARHLVFGRYIVNERRDIIRDATVPHVHQSHDLLL